jgi:hypothetical protein
MSRDKYISCFLFYSFNIKPSLIIFNFFVFLYTEIKSKQLYFYFNVRMLFPVETLNKKSNDLRFKNLFKHLLQKTRYIVKYV